MKAGIIKLYLAAGTVLFFLATASNRAQPVSVEHATDFTSEQYWEAPNQQQIKMRLSGAEAAPLPGGLLDVKNLKVEKFSKTGKTEAVVRAPQCTYAPLEGMASSAGRMELLTGDGKIKIQVEGEGFLWRQTESSLTISNRVRTVIELPAGNRSFFYEKNLFTPDDRVGQRGGGADQCPGLNAAAGGTDGNHVGQRGL